MAVEEFLYKDPRIMSMGGANTAVGGYSTAVFSNPAGLIKIKKSHGIEAELLGLGMTSSAKTQKFVDDLSNSEDSEVINTIDKYSGDVFNIDISNYSSFSYHAENDIATFNGITAANVTSKEIIYQGKKYPITPLGSTYNGLLEYVANINANLASNQTVSIDVVIYDGKGYFMPHDSILDRDGESSVVVLEKNHAKAKRVKIIANGEQGVVVEGVSPDENIVVEKQDILLKLLGGIKARAID